MSYQYGQSKTARRRKIKDDFDDYEAELLAGKCACCPNMIEDDDSSPIPLKDRVLCAECKKRADELTSKVSGPIYGDVIWKGNSVNSGWGFM
jgi:hypothetical protein